MSEFSIKQIDNSIEKQVLIGLIVSGDFLRQTKYIYNHTFFKNKGARYIAKWCFQYYEQYEKPPGKTIEQLFRGYSKSTEFDEATFDYIDTLLKHLLNKWNIETSSINVDYLLHSCESYFQQQSMQALADDVVSLLSEGAVKEAQRKIESYHHVALPVSKGINPFTDLDMMYDAFEADTQPLFRMPGALGEILNEQLYRQGFIGIQAKEKAGKSWLLQEFIMRAIRGHRKVAVFEMGDMSTKQRLCRIASYITKKPYKRHAAIGSRIKVQIPELVDEGGEKSVSYTEQLIEPVSASSAIAMCNRWAKRLGKNMMKISEYASDTGTTQDILNDMARWEKEEGFIADVVIVDYADIMVSSDKSKQSRDQVNDIWKGLRRISQQKNVLMITATQADADSYNKTNQTLKNFSEDKRKYSHVTAMFALNQTPKEKRNNTIRVSPMLIREGDCDMNKQVAVLQCLSIGRPYIDSFITYSDVFSG